MITAIVSIRWSPCGGRMLCVHDHGYDAAPAPGARTVGFKGSRPSAAAPCAQAHGSSDCAYLNKQKPNQASALPKPAFLSRAPGCGSAQLRVAAPTCWWLAPSAQPKADAGGGHASIMVLPSVPPAVSQARPARRRDHELLIQFREYNIIINTCPNLIMK